MDARKYIDLNDDVNPKDLLYMNPFIIKMLIWTIAWCEPRGIKPYWTSFHRKPNDGISKSTTHQDFRAADLSLINAFGWTENLIDKYEIDFNREFENVGALKWSVKEGDYVSIPIYIHGKGSGLHAHIQVRKNLTINEEEL